MFKSVKLLMVMILCMGCFSGCKKSEPETAKDVTAERRPTGNDRGGRNNGRLFKQRKGCDYEKSQRSLF